MGFGQWLELAKIAPPAPSIHGDKYLVTTEGKQVVAAKYVRFTAKGKQKARWEWNGRLFPWKITAWMSYPEPF